MTSYPFERSVSSVMLICFFRASKGRGITWACFPLTRFRNLISDFSARGFPIDYVITRIYNRVNWDGMYVTCRWIDGCQNNKYVSVSGDTSIRLYTISNRVDRYKGK